MSFSQVYFHIYGNVCRDLCSVTQRYAITFLKSVKQISIFSETLEGQEILRRKTNKSYSETTIQNDPGNNTKKLYVILEITMPKAIIEASFELLVTNFYAQISCSCHSK